MKIRVYYDSTDAQGIVYHANYLKFCEQARSQAFINAKIDIFSPNRHFVVTEINAKYHKPAVFGDVIEIRSQISECKKATAKIEQKIFKIENLNGEKCEELLFTAIVSVAYLQNKRPIKFDEKIGEFLQNFNKN